MRGSLHSLKRALSGARSSGTDARSDCCFEKLEPRILLSADLLGGAVANDLSDAIDNDSDYDPHKQRDLGELVAPFISSLGRDQSGGAQATLPGSLDLAGLDNYFDRGPGSNLESANADVFAEGYAALLSDAANDELRQEIIFIDAATPDYEQLVEGIATDTTQTRFLVFILDSQRDGIEQIGDVLANYQGIDAIHLVSHGSDGEVQLGNGVLNSNTLGQYTQAIQSWQQALDAEADFLIYGCNLAASDVGQGLLQSLANLTGADMAASDDLTGSAQLGGDWELEYQLGTIDAQTAFSQAAQQQWQGVLATFTVNTTADTIDANASVTSLREAIIDANALGGSNTIMLGAGTYNFDPGLGGAGEDLALSGDLDITSSISIIGADAATTIIDAGGIDRVFHILTPFETLELSDLTVRGGAVSGGGANGIGGGILTGTNAQLDLDRVIITGNTAVDGAGLYIDGTANLDNVAITGNTTAAGAGSEGGGLYNKGFATLNNVTISGNTAGTGGGIYNAFQGDDLDLTNVTVSGNTATSAAGGGIYNDLIATLKNVTISDNTAQTQGGGIFDAFVFNISNTIVANNTSVGGSGHDVFGTFNSDGSNVIEDTAGSADFGADTTGDPSLVALGDNGGFTQTHALLGSSNAINSVTASAGPATDQRGYTRDDGLIDIGAYEFGALPVGTFVVTNINAAGAGSLEQTILDANAAPGSNTIFFDIAGAGPHVITVDADGLPDIDDQVFIDGWSEPDYAGGGVPVIQIAGNATAGDGLYLATGSDGSTIRGLSITGFINDQAIDIRSDDNTLVGNYLGLAPDGTTVDGNNSGIAIINADDNQIGSTAVNERNLIAGNSYSGIRISGTDSDDNLVINNDIGLDATGTVVNVGAFGIVSFNGPDATRIGGADTDEGNRIAGFGRGILLDSNPAPTTNTSILGNLIWGNAQYGIGLENEGITYNDAGDADSGSNDLLNFPFLTSVIQNGANLDVDFNLDVPAGTYRIELFENPAGISASSFGEGEVFLDSVSVVSSGTGTQSFSTTLLGVTASDIYSVTATATVDLGGGNYGSTSEFSLAYGAPAVILDQFNSVAYNGSDGLLPWAGDWQEVGEANGAASGGVTVATRLAEQGLLLDASLNGAWREADLSSASTALLTFDWGMFNSELLDRVSLEISTNGGSSWTTLDTFTGPANDSALREARYDISAWIDSDTQIKFETSFNLLSAGDEFFVDNMQIELDPVNQATLWLSTGGTATDNNGPVGDANDIVGFEAPDLGFELGNGAGGTTDGTFDIAHSLPEGVRALHYVNGVTTVDTWIGGSPGTYDLQPGQIVVSMRAADTLDFDVLTVGGGNITVNNTDVLVYTPGTGEYEFLLQDAILKPDASPANIHAVSIVEQQTTIGVDTILEAGTYLIARSDPAVHSDISTYDNTFGRRDLLLGPDFLSASDHIQGIELLESDLTLGDTTLLKGTLLISIESAMDVGSSGGTIVSAEAVDVVALTINATEQDSVTKDTNVDAQIFLDGSDIALSIGGGGEINGLTLVGNVLGNSAPTVNATASDTGTEDTDQVYTHAQMLTLIGGADVDDADANLSIAISNVSNGTVALSGGSGGAGTTFTFTPTANFVGNLAFDYQLSDDEAPTPATSVVGTATVTLSADNDAPTVDVPVAIFINEIHYDNIGPDSGEAIEIAGVAGNDLNGWQLVMYSGFDGSVYDTVTLSGTIPNQADNFGTLAFNFPVNGIQNATTGNPDGVALVDPTGTVVQFLSYEGSFMALEGPANGMTSTDIGVAEDNATTAVGDSLQLTGPGPAFTWAAAAANSFGAINAGQDFAALAAATHQVIVEDGSLVFSAANGNAITVDDVDAAFSPALDPVSVKLDVVNGNLSLGSVADLGTVLGNGTNSISFTGTLAELNAALDGLTYQPGLNFNGSDTLSVLVDDQGNWGAGGNLLANGVVHITVDPINDAPTLSGGPYNLGATDEDTTSTGVQVSTILAGLTQTDDDGDTLGIAVTAASGSGGWEYSTDSTDGTDGTWTSFGSTTPTGALILSNSSWVRYIPDGLNGESVSIDFRAWDGTQNSSSTTGSPATSNPGVGGGISAYSTGTAQASLTVTDVNDVPTGSGALTSASLNDNAGATNLFGGLTVADVDTGENDLVLRISLSDDTAGTISGGSFTDQGGGVYTAMGLTVVQANTALDNVQFTPTDNTGFGSTFATDISVDVDDGDAGYQPVLSATTVTITQANDDPTLDNAIADQTATEDTLFNFTFAANSFGDVDGDTLTYTSDASGWLSFNAATRTFSGTPLNGDVGTTTVTVTADDGNGGIPATETFDIVVANSNDDPTLDNAIADQAATEDTLFNFTFAANSFGDIDVGDTLTYTAQLSGGGALPAWLGFDSATRTFNGTPLNDDVGTISVEIVADDGNGGTPATDTFDIVISNQNDAPTGPVTISGTLAEGEILTATYTLADDDGLGPLNYQWQRNGVDIAGATSDSYTLTDMDPGAAITMLVSYTDARGTAESVSSNTLNFIVIIPEDTLPELVVETPPEVVDTDVTIEPETDTDPQPDTTDIIDSTGTGTTEPEVTLLDEDSDESVRQISAEIDRNDPESDLAPTLNDPQSINTESGANLITMQAEFTPYNDPLVLVNFQGFVDGVDELREEVAESKNTTAKVVGSTFAVSAGLSAGYVAWLARSGAILSSVLSALPAWRFIDPLPVLTRSADGSEDEESLQSMIQGSAKDVDVDADGAAQQAAQEEEQIDDQADNPDGRE